MKLVFIIPLIAILYSSIDFTFPPEKSNYDSSLGSLEITFYGKRRDIPANKLAYRISQNDFIKEGVIVKGHFKLNNLSQGLYTLYIFDESFTTQYAVYKNIKIERNSLTYFTTILPKNSELVSYHNHIISYNDTLKSGHVSGTVELNENNLTVQNELNKDAHFFGDIHFYRNNDKSKNVIIPVDSLGYFYSDDVKPGIYKAFFFKNTDNREYVRSPSIVGIVVLPGRESITQHRFLRLGSSYRVPYEPNIFNFFWQTNFAN